MGHISHTREKRWGTGWLSLASAAHHNHPTSSTFFRNVDSVTINHISVEAQKKEWTGPVDETPVDVTLFAVVPSFGCGHMRCQVPHLHTVPYFAVPLVP